MGITIGHITANQTTVNVQEANVFIFPDSSIVKYQKTGSIASGNLVTLGLKTDTTTWVKEPTNIKIQSEVTSLSADTFNNCQTLAQITLPDSLRTIYARGFRTCTSLKDVYIYDLKKWCEIQFSDSDANPLVPGKANLRLNGQKVTSLTIPEGITQVKQYAFDNCNSITSVTIPSAVTSIGQYAFNRCSNISVLTINGNNLTSIGDYAFGGCNSLTAVSLPSSVTSIGKYSFSDNGNLTSFSAPGLVTIGEYSFSNNTRITSSINLPNVTTIGSSGFYNCNSLASMTIGPNISSIGSNAFNKCSSLKDLTIMKTMDEVKAMANYSWGLTSGCVITCTDGEIII